MYKPTRKSHPLLKIITNSMYDLPTTLNLSTWWNMGSLLGLCLIIQLLTGLFLAMHYTPHTNMAFSSVIHITQDVTYGWLIRYIHANSASMFFFCMYLHVGRGIYYGSYINTETWHIGVIMMILVMMAAFLGYVLVWGQMSFWAATVITNLLSAIPYIGKALVEWVWGGFAVDNATLTRFYAIHFLTPFIIVALSMIHLMFLHTVGSNSPLGMASRMSKIPFHNYYSTKDMSGFIILFLVMSLTAQFSPNIFNDPENFIPANPLVTPTHIKPEWYFLWAYAILRSIPNKLGGVTAMFSAILILILLPSMNQHKMLGHQFYPPTQSTFWFLLTTTLILTWVGGSPVEPPYETIGQIFTFLYFFLYSLSANSPTVWTKMSL